MTSVKERPKPRRSVQFSLMALLVVTTICAILFAWWRDHTQLQHRLELEVRRAAIARDRAMKSEAMARMAQQMAEMERREAQAALHEATSQPQSGQESNANE